MNYWQMLGIAVYLLCGLFASYQLWLLSNVREFRLSLLLGGLVVTVGWLPILIVLGGISMFQRVRRP
jgi:hypothetical protein